MRRKIVTLHEHGFFNLCKSAENLQRLPAEQAVPQAIIDPLALQELLVGAFFLNAVAAKNKDAVGVLDRGQAVGDGQRRAAFRQRVQALPDKDLALVIQCAGGFIQQQNGRFFKNTRAIEIRCFCPPDSFTPRSPT